MSGLLSGLVDDAGLFPPESLPMGDALARHHTDEVAGHPMLSHRFLCPASRLAELRAEPGLDRWIRGPEPGRHRPAAEAERPGGRRGPGLRLGLIGDTGLVGLPAAMAELAEDHRVVLELIEIPAPSAESVGETLEALVGVGEPVYLEGPRDTGWIKTVATWRAPGGLRGAKVRCGGVRADLFPSPAELAAFICACAEFAVNFKATAGLHGAVRHRDPQTGFEHHGYLNLLVATARAGEKGSVEEVAAVLALTDEAALVAEARSISARSGLLARSLFRAYGSCSTSEPREEATRLGLLGLS